MYSKIKFQRLLFLSSCTENNPDQKFKGTLPEKQKGKKYIHVYIPQVKILRAKKIYKLKEYYTCTCKV